MNDSDTAVVTPGTGTAVARHQGMRIVKTLLGFGLLAASVAVLRGRRRALRAIRPSEVSFDDTVGTSGPSHDTLAALDQIHRMNASLPG